MGFLAPYNIKEHVVGCIIVIWGMSRVGVYVEEVNILGPKMRFETRELDYIIFFSPSSRAAMKLNAHVWACVFKWEKQYLDNILLSF